MSARAAVLDRAVEPFACEPRKTGLKWAPTRVRERERGVDAARVAKLQRLEIGLKRVAEEDGRRGRGEESKDVRLDFGEGDGDRCERFSGDAGPAKSKRYE